VTASSNFSPDPDPALPVMYASLRSGCETEKGFPPFPPHGPNDLPLLVTNFRLWIQWSALPSTLVIHSSDARLKLDLLPPWPPRISSQTLPYLLNVTYNMFLSLLNVCTSKSIVVLYTSAWWRELMWLYT